MAVEQFAAFLQMLSIMELILLVLSFYYLFKAAGHVVHRGASSDLVMGEGKTIRNALGGWSQGVGPLQHMSNLRKGAAQNKRYNEIEKNLTSCLVRDERSIVEDLHRIKTHLNQLEQVDNEILGKK